MIETPKPPDFDQRRFLAMVFSGAQDCIKEGRWRTLILPASLLFVFPPIAAVLSSFLSIALVDGFYSETAQSFPGAWVDAAITLLSRNGSLFLLDAGISGVSYLMICRIVFGYLRRGSPRSLRDEGILAIKAFPATCVGVLLLALMFSLLQPLVVPALAVAVLGTTLPTVMILETRNPFVALKRCLSLSFVNHPGISRWHALGILTIVGSGFYLGVSLLSLAYTFGLRGDQMSDLPSWIWTFQPAGLGLPLMTVLTLMAASFGESCLMLVLAIVITSFYEIVTRKAFSTAL